MLTEQFTDYLENSIKKNWNIQAFSDYNGESFSYAEVGLEILKFHVLFESLQIKKGDKIALIGKNSSRWAIVYLSAVTYGAVIVPILPDFIAEDIRHIVNHSDSVLLFASDTIFETMDIKQMNQVKGVISVNTFQTIAENSGSFKEICRKAIDLHNQKHVGKIQGESFFLPDVTNKDLAVISYTSGTTGFSKGVMIPHNSLAGNIRFAQNHMPLDPGDNIVSFLPLAHTYGCAFEFLFPFSIGCHITFLTKTPSPQIIIKAFQEIRPSLVLSVPLVIEKIYKKQILPVIEKPVMKVILKIPGLNNVIYSSIKKKLNNVFGGKFREIVIGGAPFNMEAEKFFRKIKFPYTVGYGMTECGPLISYSSWKTNKLGASGKAVDTLEVTIDSENPGSEVGEIILRGEHLMYGYYKNDKATNEVIDKDGWFHTGDVGTIGQDGNIFIKGRIKSLIVGPNGKNIYPEELEAKINNKFGIGESLVVLRNDKLVALIYPDYDALKANNIPQADIGKMYEEYRKDINATSPGYMSISKFDIHNEEFQKTPKRSVKRFLYS